MGYSGYLKGDLILSFDLWSVATYDAIGPRGYYLETDPDPIAMGIRVKIFIHRPCQSEDACNIVVYE